MSKKVKGRVMLEFDNGGGEILQCSRTLAMEVFAIKVRLKKDKSTADIVVNCREDIFNGFYIK